VALILDLAQSVAVGPFNPHIITPEWLVRWNVLPDQEVNIRLAPVIDGSAFRFGRLEWEVDPRRLMVSSQTLVDERGHDAGHYVSEILRLLPHTPVSAVGHNFHFVSSLGDWEGRPLPLLGRRGLQELGQAEGVRWAGVFRRGETRIEITLGHNRETVVVLFNHHHNTNPRAIEEAQAAAHLLRPNFETSRAMLRELLDQEVNLG
jgi:hypothetical protein